MLWIAMIGAMLSFIGLGYSIEKSDGISILAVFSTLGIFLSIIGIFSGLSTEPVSHEYLGDEYVLEYKITTIGEKSDTTYVLTKIKND